VAPSGGRDRPDETGEYVVAPFDLKALDMFKLVCMQTRKVIDVCIKKSSFRCIHRSENKQISVNAYVQ
jgi:hypothetical protein